MSVFLAPDRSIAVEIEPRALRTMLDICSRADGLETGGVLIGRYTVFGDRVIVSRVTGPPRDSQRYRFNFVRGTAGLTTRFERAWRQGLYYVGEWHLHPEGSPHPSDTDSEQVLAFSRQRDYRCQHPVLVVIGGHPPTQWLIASAVVLGGGLVELQDAASR